MAFNDAGYADIQGDVDTSTARMTRAVVELRDTVLLTWEIIGQSRELLRDADRMLARRW